MHPSFMPALEHLKHYVAIPHGILLALLSERGNNPQTNLQALLGSGLLERAPGNTRAYVLGPKGTKLVGQKRMDGESYLEAVRLGCLKHATIVWLASRGWSLDATNDQTDRHDLAFITPQRQWAFVRCTLKDMSVESLRQMLNRYVYNHNAPTEMVVITARRPEKYRSYLERSEFSAVRFMPASIYDCLGA